jgi:hypothetical protein
MKSGQIIRWLAAAAGLKPAVIERGRSPAVINVSHALAEAIANILKPGLAALIFDAIVQECRNGEVLVPPIPGPSRPPPTGAAIVCRYSRHHPTTGSRTGVQ